MLKTTQGPGLAGDAKTDAHPGGKARETTPLVTIAIPTRNRSSLLRECVRSALAQSYTAIEVLVSNNASTDNTSEVLRSFGDPRIREVVNETNIGLQGNWNNCINHAKGEYFVILSDDNTLHPNFVASAVDLIRQAPDLPIVAGGYDVLIPHDNRVIPAALPAALETGLWDGSDVLVEHLRGNFTFGTLSCVVRTDLLRRNGGFLDISAGGEELMLARLLMEGRAGVVKQQCASQVFHQHDTNRHSASLSADTRFNDICTLMEALSKTAGETITNDTARHAIQESARTYLWYRTLQELAFCRFEGATVMDVMGCLWRWRKPLAKSSLRNVAAAIRWRSVGRILLPEWMVGALHRLEQARRPKEQTATASYQATTP